MRRKTKQRSKRKVIRRKSDAFTEFDIQVGNPTDAFADDGMYGYDI